MAQRMSHPRFRREGVAPQIELTDDDVAILRHVYRHRFIRAEDLYRLFAGRSADRLSRRLTLLYRARLLDRPIAQIDRFKPGGSQSLVYGLDTQGARYLKEKFGVAIGAVDWRAKNRSYTRESLDHTLAVTRFLVDLEIACRTRPELSIIAFDDILTRSPDATKRSRNPASWPVAVQWHGVKSVVNIAPDAIFGLRIAKPQEPARSAYFFLEIDRGTMTIVPSERVRESDAFPYRATILRKLYAYADSWRLGLHKTQFGIQSLRVLVLTNSEARAQAMRRAAEEFVIKPMRLSPGLFLFGARTANDPFEQDLEDGAGQIIRLVPQAAGRNDSPK